ncbi:MAG: recombinase [Candidatus Cloacimonadota bacterium]|nr:MAG: recombinase [Candidatus Cloacimonadota bacterium]
MNLDKVIGYIRVSTIGQAEHGISLENQEEKIKQYCSLNNLELIDIIRDEGLSAKSLKKRPQAIDMLNRAKEEQLGIVVYKLDRMFRNTIESLQTIDLLAKSGAGFHSIQERLDTSSAFGKFFITQISAMAELERNIISERTKDALALKKQQGKRIGTIPFGYSVSTTDNQTLIQNDKEMEILTFIQDKRLQGLSHRKIANSLNTKGYTNRNSNPFTKTSITHICKRVLKIA